MLYEIAQFPEEVLEAWGLVYRVYMQSGYIKPNCAQIFAFPACVQSDTAVILGRFANQLVSTLTCIADTKGIPLDSVYPDEIQKLRESGVKIVEYGLLVSIQNKPTGYFELMQYAYHFAKATGYHDLVCGVNPERALLYKRLFGFMEIGTRKQYEKINNAPVTLLHANIHSEHFLTSRCAKLTNAYADMDFSRRCNIPKNDFIRNIVLEINSQTND